MATLEELKATARTEIEAKKTSEGGDGLWAQVNNERREFTDAEYEQAIIDKANADFDEQENGYKSARQEAYNSIPDQLDQLWHAVDAGLFGDDAKTAEWYTDIDTVKTDNPKPS